MLATVDLVLRFAYVALAPLALFAMAKLFPLTGIIASTALATAIALIGPERWQARVGKLPVVGRILGGFGKLGVYYQEHPPKPLLYYVVYPVLLPYWLIKKSARREFLLYRNISMIAMVILAGAGALDYWRVWRPQIPFNLFLGVSIGMFILQLLVTFALVMPIVTTLLVYQRRGLRKTLRAMLAVMVLSSFGGAVIASKNHQPAANTMIRVRERTHFDKLGAIKAIAQGLDAAWASLARAHDDGAAALDAGRAAMEGFYHRDETLAFHLYGDEGVVMLFVRFAQDKYPPIWLARTRDKTLFTRESLPPGAAGVLGLSGP